MSEPAPFESSVIWTYRPHRVWGVENSGDQLTRAVGGKSVDVHIDNPAEELNYRKCLLRPYWAEVLTQ